MNSDLYAPEKVTCVPRSIRILAKQRGIEIPPERFWELRPLFPDWAHAPYSSAVSYALDICRYFRLASHFDVHQDVSMTLEALRRTDEVFGVLCFLQKRHPENGQFLDHCAAVFRIHEELDTGDFLVHVRNEDKELNTLDLLIRCETLTLPRRHFFAVLLK